MPFGIEYLRIMGVPFGSSQIITIRHESWRINYYWLLDTYLKRIVKLHVPVSLGAVGIGYDGGVVSHVVVQAERDSDPWPDDGYKLF